MMTLGCEYGHDFTLNEGSVVSCVNSGTFLVKANLTLVLSRQLICRQCKESLSTPIKVNNYTLAKFRNGDDFHAQCGHGANITLTVDVVKEAMGANVLVWDNEQVVYSPKENFCMCDRESWGTIEIKRFNITRLSGAGQNAIGMRFNGRRFY